MKTILLFFILSCFFPLNLKSVGFLNIQVPRSWSTWSLPITGFSLENFKEDCFYVSVMNHTSKIIRYKIYVEEIPGDEENVKVRVAYEFECFPGTTKWINFIGDLVVSKEILNSKTFRVGLSISPSDDSRNSYGGLTAEIIVNNLFYEKKRIENGRGLFVFAVEKRRYV